MEELLDKEIVRIYTLGGVLSTGDLLKIVAIANKIETAHLHFGIRQDILMMVDKKYVKQIRVLFSEMHLEYEVVSEFTSNFHSNNIVSSFPSASILKTTSWVRTGHYYSILDEFKKTPQLKVNIVDPMQGLVPLLTGNINFVASEKREYWYLFIKYPDSDKLELWPMYVATDDIQTVAYLIIDLIGAGKTSVKQIKPSIDEKIGVNMPRVMKRPEYPLVPLPNYDGIHQVDDRFWIGIYKRKNDFAVSFLEDLGKLCLEHKIAKISLTPWHSLLVKGIEKEAVVKWEMLLNKYGINTQHSSLELNWQVPTLDEEASELKHFIYQEFDKNDIRTNGLTFGIITRNIVPSTNVVIEKEIDSNTYKVSHSKDFNPNNKEDAMYSEDVDREDLPASLMALTKNYVNSIETQLSSIFEFDLGNDLESTDEEKVKEYVYECIKCLSAYDPKYGDEEQDVEENTSFEDLPENYGCTVCETSKNEFVKKEKIEQFV